MHFNVCILDIKCIKCTLQVQKVHNYVSKKYGE